MQKPSYGRPILPSILVLSGLTVILVLCILLFLRNSFSVIINDLICVLIMIIGYITIYAYLLCAYIFWGRYRFKNKILDLYKLKGDENVLCIESSLGLFTIALAKKLTTGNCTGMDVYNLVNNEKMTGRIKNNAALAGVADKIEIAEGQMPDTSFPDESFDVIISIMGLTKFKKGIDLLKVSSEINRLLKVDGTAMIADVGKRDKLHMALLSKGLHVKRVGNYFSTAFIPLKVMVVTKGYKPERLVKFSKPGRSKLQNAILISLILSAVISSGLLIKAFLKTYGDSILDFQLNVSSTYSLTAEDSNVIDHRYLDKIKVTQISKNKIRNTISLLKYDNKYSLLIYKIGLVKTAPLSGLVKFKANDNDVYSKYLYGEIVLGYFALTFKDIGSWYKIESPISNIYLTVSGDSIRQVTNGDSIFSYNLLCKNFAIRYLADAPVDIAGEIDEEQSDAPKCSSTNILFLKRNNSIYFLLMSSDDPKISVPSDLLYKIVTGG